MQANPGPGVAAAHMVQAPADGARHQEGARRHHPRALRAARTLAGSCELPYLLENVLVEYSAEFGRIHDTRTPKPV